MKVMKSLAALCLCLMMAVSLVPAVQADALTVTKKGVYSGAFDTSSATKNIKGVVRVIWKGNKLIMKGKPFYLSEKEFRKQKGGAGKALKSGKREFKLSAGTKYYKGKKKISKTKAKKVLKKYSKTSLKHAIVIIVKNKKAKVVAFE